MEEKKSFRIEWLIIVVLFLVILSGSLYVFTGKSANQNNESQSADTTTTQVIGEQAKLIQKYEKLEKAYNNTISEIESVIDEDNINLSILKENLAQILSTIHEEKAKINQGSDTTGGVEDNTAQLEELLNMSKEVLAERLVEEKNKNEKLTIDNRKLHTNLKKSMDHFEQEKNKNVRLNAEVAQIKGQIQNLVAEGSTSNNELKTLKRQKDEIEKRLIESNKTIKEQTQQIQDLGEIIRKVNINCYYIYEKDNPLDEAKIYLTSQGVAEKYIKYFIRKKPDIYIEFRIAKDLFENSIEKVELKLYNSLNVEIYSVSKVVNSESLKIIIPNKNFTPGKYSLELKAGDENLLVDDRYWFKVG